MFSLKGLQKWNLISESCGLSKIKYGDFLDDSLKNNNVQYQVFNRITVKAQYSKGTFSQADKTAIQALWRDLGLPVLPSLSGDFDSMAWVVLHGFMS